MLAFSEVAQGFSPAIAGLKGPRYSYLNAVSASMRSARSAGM